MLTLLFAVVTASAGPLQLTHSARVVDASGEPINGSHDITISLYDAPDATEAAWTETQSLTLEGGYFTAILGQNTATNALTTESVVDGSELWVGLSIDTDPELPVRTPITSTAYAGRAQVAESVSNGTYLQVERRMLRYHQTCASIARNSYTNVAAVTPGDSTIARNGNQVCAGYNGNNSQTNWTCIAVPYVYTYAAHTSGYQGTDIRPTWNSCSTTLGPGSANGNYPWLDPGAGTGVMMACCVR